MEATERSRGGTTNNISKNLSRRDAQHRRLSREFAYVRILVEYLEHKYSHEYLVEQLKKGKQEMVIELDDFWGYVNDNDLWSKVPGARSTKVKSSDTRRDFWSTLQQWGIVIRKSNKRATIDLPKLLGYAQVPENGEVLLNGPFLSIHNIYHTISLPSSEASLQRLKKELTLLGFVYEKKCPSRGCENHEFRKLYTYVLTPTLMLIIRISIHTTHGTKGALTLSIWSDVILLSKRCCPLTTSLREITYHIADAFEILDSILRSILSVIRRMVKDLLPTPPYLALLLFSERIDIAFGNIFFILASDDDKNDENKQKDLLKLSNGFTRSITLDHSHGYPEIELVIDAEPFRDAFTVSELRPLNTLDLRALRVLTRLFANILLYVAQTTRTVTIPTLRRKIQAFRPIFAALTPQALSESSPYLDLNSFLYFSTSQN